MVRLAREHGITVTPVPGASAVIAALSAAGVPSDAFTFAGFLPAKQSARLKTLQSYLTIPHTLVFYESTHRIVNAIEDIVSVFGAQAQIVLAKELTKTFERFVAGTGDDVKAWLLSDKGHTKGEFVLIISPRAVQEEIASEDVLLTLLLKELPLKQAVKIVCEWSGKSKNELYQHALELSKTL